MAWFKRDKKSIEQTTPPEERRVRTEGLWVKCESCRTIVFRKDLEANLFVCPKCQFHFQALLGVHFEMELALGADEEIRFEVLAEDDGAAGFALDPQAFGGHAALLGRSGLLERALVA